MPAPISVIGFYKGVCFIDGFGSRQWEGNFLPSGQNHAFHVSLWIESFLGIEGLEGKSCSIIGASHVGVAMTWPLYLLLPSCGFAKDFQLKWMQTVCAAVHMFTPERAL